jgi:amino acid adenylation domain-containing protein
VSVQDLLGRLRQLDVRLWLDGERLRFSAPDSVMTDALKAEVSARRDEIRAWLERAASQAGSVMAIPKAPTDAPPVLSFSQERLWFVDLLESGGAAYNIPMTLTLRGALHVEALARSFASVIERHEVLRSRIVIQQHRPALQCHAWDRFELPVVQVCGADRAALADIVRQEIATPFDVANGHLLRARLFRLGDDEHVLVIVVHNIVCDAWALGILFRELGGYYREHAGGDAYRPSPLPIQYADYAAWQRSADNAARFGAQIAFWRRHLDRLTPLELPGDRVRPAVPSNRGAADGFVIEGPLLDACRSLWQRHRTTPFTLMLAVFKVLLHRYTSVTDVAVGVPVGGRSAPGTGDLIGCFLNTLVLRSDLAGSPSFAELLARVQQTAIDAQDHQDVPFEQILQELEVERSPGRNPLFQIMFNYIDTRDLGLDLAGLEVTYFNTAAQFTKFDLTCYVHGGPRRMSVTFDYATDLFDAATIRTMLGHYRRLLASAVADPGTGINRLAMCGDRERPARTPAMPLHEATIVERFARHAQARPEQPAVVTMDKALSNAELREVSARAAAAITSWCARQQCHEAGRIGLLLDDPADMIAAMLGVLTAGHAFVPLDPSAPAARLAQIVEDADLALVIAGEQFEKHAAEWLPGVMCWPRLVAEHHPAGLAGHSPDPDAPAYLLFTSGSTGSPKAVLQTHRGLLHHAAAFTRALSLSTGDRLSLLSAFSFDTAIQDVFAALFSGATLHAVNLRDARAEVARRALEQQQLSVLHMTPTVFRHLFADRDADAPIQSVRLVVLGGEPMRGSDHALYRRHFGRDCSLVNGLGATECSTMLQYWMDHDSDATLRALPVGHALPGCEVVLVDPDGNETDVYGEIAVLSVPEGTCYWKDSERTARCFSRGPGDDARRLYLSGDLGSRRADGSIVFEGRRDQLVKLRGMRIELAEVEATLEAHPAVSRAAVLVRGDVGLEFLFAACQAQPDATGIDADQLRAWLRNTLPEYMVPRGIVAVAALPLTASGKIDRRAIAALPLEVSEAQDPADEVLPHSDLQRAIAAIWQQVLGMDHVPLRRNFFDLGGHSLLLVEVRARIEELTGRQIGMSDLFQFPTVESLAGFLDPAERTAVRRQRAPTRRVQRDDNGVAIVAMTARLPGARDLDTFWRNLCDGVESIERMDLDAVLSGGLDERVVRDPAYVPAHSSIADVDMFDAAYFDYTPREAELMDPQQRLFLECASEALAQAGIDPQRADERIGVFAGAGMTSYLYLLLQRPDLVRASGGWQAVIRSDKDYLPLRVSYKLNLHGPSIDVQTACSTSLVAVHQARTSLLAGDCDVALAGGVTLRVPRHPGYLYEEGGILSPDGRCRPFDARAAGTVFGEGVGVVVLKRLSDALADGDPIRAVIRGTAVNNDGADKVGFTAPSVSAQAELIALAQAAAGVEASSIGYVEAHGTATSLGDPIEVSALNQAFEGVARGTCALGSVKGNIGHLDRAAGVAGLIKTVLVLEHGQIPPSLHYERANPEIDFDAGPFYVNTVLSDWERVDGRARRAGVSSFGMGGTNAHAIVEEAPPVAESDAPSRRWHVLPVSARSGQALDAACEALATHLERHPGLALADVAYTLQVGRTDCEQRAAVVCTDHEGALRGLRGDAGGMRSGGTLRDSRVPEVVFLYPGQGTQYPNMGRALYDDEPVYRDTVDGCCAVLQDLLNVDMRTLLFPAAGADAEAAEALTRTSLTQAALFVTEYATTRLLNEWGIHPAALLGHSVGELVAACVSGVLSRDEALQLVAARGRLMEAAPAGVMLSVAVAAQVAEAYSGDGVWLSVVNGPTASVLSCTVEAAAGLETRLAADGVAYRRLKTSHAFHCGLMDGVLGPLTAAARRLHAGKVGVPFVSNVSGSWITDAEVRDSGYWSRQVRSPVQFAAGVEALRERYPDAVLLEVGPGQMLGQLVRGVVCAPVVASTLGGPAESGDAGERFARCLGALWCAGVSIDWARAVRGERRLKVALPGYPFQRKRYWVNPARAAAAQVAQREHDVARWFHVPTWQHALPAPAPAARTPGRWLILGAEYEPARELVSALRTAGHTVTSVRAGECFAAEGSGYRLRPAAGSDYDALLDDLAARDAIPDRVLHLWALTGIETPDLEVLVERCFHAPLKLVQSLGRRAHDAPLRLTFVSDNLQEVTGAEVICAAKATLIGPCRVIPLEYPNVACRSIDVVDLAPDATEGLLRELEADVPDAFVAYRNGYRWTPGHLQSPPAALDGVPPRLRHGGVYLVTGGLGGIGLTLAGYLAETCAAKLVLVTRGGLPPRDSWDALQAGEPADAQLVERIRAVRALEANGAEVMVEGVDVASREQVAALIGRVRARFGSVSGVIHAAGVAGGGVIQMKTAAAADSVLAPKVLGARNLVELLNDAPPDFVLFCSSINALFGVPGQVDYCAANAYLDALALQQRRNSGTFTVSVNWDTWREVGMAVETEVPDAMQRGRQHSLASAIAPSEGVQAFERVLASGWPRVLVTPRTAAVQTAAAAPDRPTGESEASVVGTHERPELDSYFVDYRDDLERRIVLIWRELLGLARVGVEDNFLELGGHSLLATQLLARLRRELGVDWTLDTVFKAPTVAEQAELARQVQHKTAPATVIAHTNRIKEMSVSEREQLLAKARQARVGEK